MTEIDPASTPSGRALAWTVAAVIAAGAALRIHFLDSALWYDEIVTLVDSVRFPFAVIVTQFPSNNNHVLYSVLARASTYVFGEHAWVLRLPALVFGIASLPVLYVLGRKVSESREALWATVLLALSYHHVWFSQNARGYTILLFCALLSTYLLIVALRENRRWAYVVFGLVSAASAYTHLTMVLFVVGQAIVAAAYTLSRGGWKWRPRDFINPGLGFLVAAVVTLLLYAPMLLDIQAFFRKEPTGAAVATPGWAIAETIRGLQLGYAAGGGIVVGGILMLAGAYGYYLRDRLALALFVVPAATLLAAVLLLQRPTFPRFFFFLAGFALLIVVRGTMVIGVWIARRVSGGTPGRLQTALPTALLASVALASAAALPAAYRYPKQDYEGALRYVEESAGPSGAVVLAGGGTAVPLRTFYGKPWPRLKGAAELEAARGQNTTVWVLYTFKRYIAALEPELLREITARCTAARVFRGSVADGDIVVARCDRG